MTHVKIEFIQTTINPRSFLKEVHMSIFNFLKRRKNRVNKNDTLQTSQTPKILPEWIWEQANSLPNNHVLPLNTGDGSIKLLIKTTDDIIKLVNDNPNVTFRVGQIVANKEKPVVIIAILIRFNESDVTTFDLPFSISNDGMLNDLLNISEADKLDIAFCGETIDTAAGFPLDAYFKATIQGFVKATVERYGRNWDFQDYQEVLGYIYSITPTPSAFWELLVKHDNMISIEYN